MRISGNPSDPGFREDAGLFTIYFNGRRCGWEVGDDLPVVSADDELGAIIRYRRDANGEYLTLGDTFVEETLSGVVRIIPPLPTS